jgi:hypothetical protein
MITVFFSWLVSPHHAGPLADYSFVYASRRVFTGATLYRLLLGYIYQVTTSLLHQLGGYPKEEASKSPLRAAI